MSKARVLLLNGPPGSGKDTAANHLAARYPDLVETCKFATHVKEGTHAALGIFDTLGRPVAHDAFEDVKGEPNELFGGMTPRQAYIWFSEEVMKPKFGKTVFGKIEAAKIYSNSTLYVFSDSGFVEEALEVVKVVGPENVFLVNVWRAGHSYEGDSRSYISGRDLGIPHENCVCITNRDIREYVSLVAGFVAEAILGPEDL